MRGFSADGDDVQENVRRILIFLSASDGVRRHGSRSLDRNMCVRAEVLRWPTRRGALCTQHDRNGVPLWCM